ncbi:MAG: CpaF family protein [Acidimicrobiales bacterium]
MTLKDRLAAAPPTPSPAPQGASLAPPPPPSSPGTVADTPTPVSGPDPFAAMRASVQDLLFAQLGSRIFDPTLGAEQMKLLVVERLEELLGETSIPLTPEERAELVGQLTEDVLGYGPIQQFLEDPNVTEVMVNSTDEIYVERNGVVEATGRRFQTHEHLRRVIDRIVSEVGRRIDESSPMVDARLPDGSRVNAIVPPLSVDGAMMTIRKFSVVPFRTEDLIAFRTLSPRLAAFLDSCVRGRASVLVSGGTGSGKTTLLNVLSGFVPTTERLITIEDAVELRLRQRHVIRLESRPPNIEGKGEVTIRDLVRNALRMRPDRIIVGEVRGPEALDMLQAMNTGHEGSLTTLHANSPRDALARLETMILMAGMELPLHAIREQIASAVDVIVHVSRMADGSRRVTEVSEVSGMEGQVIQLNELFLLDPHGERDEEGRLLETAQPTGLRPSFEASLKTTATITDSYVEPAVNGNGTMS